MYTYKYVYIIYAYIYICIYSNYNSLVKQCFAPLLLLVYMYIIRFVCVRLLDMYILCIRKFKGISIIITKRMCPTSRIFYLLRESNQIK